MKKQIYVPEQGYILEMIKKLEKKIEDEGITNKEEVLGNLAELNTKIEELYAVLGDINNVVFTQEDVDDVINMVDGLNNTL